MKPEGRNILELGRKTAESKRIFNEIIVTLSTVGNSWSDGEETKRHEFNNIEYEKSDKLSPSIQDFEATPVLRFHWW